MQSKKMKNLILIMTMCSLVLAKQKATTANGNTVILHDDYTWEFVEEKKIALANLNKEGREKIMEAFGTIDGHFQDLLISVK